MNSSTSNGTTNQPPPSPWKKPQPKISLSKTKSLKRKSEIFNKTSFDTENLDENDSGLGAKSAKIGKTVFNRFSINNSLNNFNFNSNLQSFDACSDKNELYSFFNGNKEQNEGTNSNQSNIPNQMTSEKLTSLCPQIIKNICSTLSSNNQSNSDVGKTDTTEDNKKQVTYQFESEEFLPIDWSLKTRVRFLSTKPFSCCNAIKSQHESDAILNYSKFNNFYQSLDQHKYNRIEENKDLFKTLFGESISYWTFPYLPWLNLYPRNINLSNLSSEPLNVEIQKSLSKSWNNSFKSLYNSLKCNQCPYFYVLTHSFVVLFKAENIGGTEEMTAVLTPSTKGLRQSLKDINFTMPLAPSNYGMKKSDSYELKNNESSNSNETFSNDNNNEKSTSKNLNTTNDENELLNNSNNLNGSGLTAEDKNSEKDPKSEGKEEDDDEENDDDYEEPDEWLEQIGLNSTVNFKASVLQRNNKNAQKDSLLNFDNRPRSTLVFLEGSDVQALFNFLLNSKSCISSSGPLTGIPPTLLSPLPFVGATLQKIKVEQNVIKSLNSLGEPLTQYAIDLIGPLMPYHIHRLCNLFRITQLDNFNMVANIYDQTPALNCGKKTEKSNSDIKITSYLDLSETRSLENNFGIYGESQAIKSISLIENKFCCNF